mmetsp:Transcript_25190/g.73922  ORF Transcript_25190/g.73922 Transcript_25190/m.73922 type:complete len:162 (-) Transcript_25190:328-813(-)
MTLSAPLVGLVGFAIGLLLGVGIQPFYEMLVALYRGKELRSMMHEYAMQRKMTDARWRSLREAGSVNGKYRKALEEQLKQLDAILIKLSPVGAMQGAAPAAVEEGLGSPLLATAPAALAAADLAGKSDDVRADPMVQHLDRMLAHRCEHVLGLAKRGKLAK